MSQAALASKAGISKMSISKIENNKCLPSWKLITKLAQALNMCPYHLIDFCVDCSNIKSCNFFCFNNHSIRDNITK